jgi:hypothetical protein
LIGIGYAIGILQFVTNLRSGGSVAWSTQSYY